MLTLNGTTTWIAWYQKCPFLYYVALLSSYAVAFWSRRTGLVRKMNQISFSFFAVLFVFSLAGTPRYIFAWCLCMFSLTYLADFIG